MKQTHTIVDEEVIRRINRGDTNAFGELYKAYYVYLCTVATKYVFDPEAAQEIINNVFLNIWHHRLTLSTPVTAYLIRAVQNRSLNHCFLPAKKVLAPLPFPSWIPAKK